MATELFYRLGLSTALLSSTTLLVLLLTLPVFLTKFKNGKRDIELMAKEFQEKTKYLWRQMIQDEDIQKFTSFARRGRSPWDRSMCRGCFQMACPSGPTGPPGEPGLDGLPGEPGDQGPAGYDGYDVQLESEPDLPCVICPAGPPGLRGHQGERGRPGNPGTKGHRGPNGSPGRHGPQGDAGPPGQLGERGAMGSPGPVGDTTIAGVGIKGPKGLPGSRGPKGPTGTAGKASNIPGMPGKTGEIGIVGPPGQPGRSGDDGPWGPPGEPGDPAAYCPSDCGVSEILAPAYITNQKVESFVQTPDKYEVQGNNEVETPPHSDEFSTRLEPPSFERYRVKPDFHDKEQMSERWAKRLWVNK